MNIKKGPSVVTTIPSNKSVNIPTDTKIIVTFDCDIAKLTIKSNVHLLNDRGEKIEADMVYGNRVLEIKPHTQLDSNDTYRVVVNGNNDPNSSKGIENLAGYHMKGDYSFIFSTAKSLSDNIINGSPNGVVVNNLSLTLEKTHNSDVEEPIRVELSDTNTFSSLLWSVEINYKAIPSTGIQPDIKLDEGLYFWRARVGTGEWSTYQFSIGTNETSSVVDDDEAPEDIVFSDWDVGYEIISTYPSDNRSNIGDNLKNVGVVFEGIIPVDTIKIYLEGCKVDGSHDTHVIEGIKNVGYDHEKNTTTVVLTLPELGGE